MRLARFVLLALVTTACPHPLPNPGQVVVSCTMDAVRNPEVVGAVLDALAEGGYRAALAAVLARFPGVTAEAIACILESLLAAPADAAKTARAAAPPTPAQLQRARAYLVEHGYEVP